MLRTNFQTGGWSSHHTGTVPIFLDPILGVQSQFWKLPCTSGVWGSFRVMGPSLPPDFSQNVFFPQAEAGRDTLRLPVSLGVEEVTCGTLGRVWAGVCEGGSPTP